MQQKLYMNKRIALNDVTCRSANVLTRTYYLDS